MITNERQYRITKAWADRFADEAARMAQTGGAPDSDRRRVYQDAYESQAEELRAQMSEYEALRAGQVSVLELDTLTALPEALIRARIAAGLTQRQLAARLGIKEQQIQRYEATRYSGVTLERVQAVADALGMRIHEYITLPVANAASAGE
jgi:ribosome-binding protein aMBF1 (putative translation factor)